MPDAAHDIARFTPGATTINLFRRDGGGAPCDDRAEHALAVLRRKASSRLARHVALERRRLTNTRPMVSFTFDDAAASAGLTGAERIEATGGRATYYIASGAAEGEERGYSLIDRDRLRELHRKGHEIGLHGHAHRAAGAFSAEHFRADLRQNWEWLHAIDESIRPTNFAYPYGLASFPRKRQLYGLVDSSRSVAPGVNAGDFDPQFLRCVELADARLTPQGLAACLDSVVRLRGWLIFCSHDIGDPPSRYGCTSALFQRALDSAASRSVEFVTVAAALGKSRLVGTMPSLMRAG